MNKKIILAIETSCDPEQKLTGLQNYVLSRRALYTGQESDCWRLVC